MEWDPESLTTLLPIYYKRIFPFKPYFQWLCYGKKPTEYLMYREFALILKGDVYLRYRSYLDQMELEKDLISNAPEKIDIGPVYNHRPSERNRVSDFKASERELIFDIDLTDYDDIRTCCQGGSMCQKCWKFMVVAVKILDRALRKDFGFKHILFLYSGRRGVHCWVCDATARKLTNEGRTAIAEYLQIITGGENETKKVHLKRIHPSVQDAYEIVNDDIVDIARDQKWLESERHVDLLLDLVPDEEGLRAAVKGILERSEGDSLESRWRQIQLRTDRVDPDLICKIKSTKNSFWKDKVPKSHNFVYQELVLQMGYPRLDINVSKSTNHLLKSPFCVHPKTGKIAVPLIAENIHLFNADECPTIMQVVNEISQNNQENAKPSNDDNDDNSEDNKGGSNRKLLEYKRTSVGPYVETFTNFVNNLLSSDSD